MRQSSFFRNLLKHEQTILSTILVYQTKRFQEKWNEWLSNISISLINVFISASKILLRENSIQNFESNYKFSEELLYLRNEYFIMNVEKLRQP